MKSQLGHAAIITALLLLVLLVLASCVSQTDKPFVCIEDDPPRPFDCGSGLALDWRSLTEAPANRDFILDTAETAAQASIERGDYIGVPSQSDLGTVRSSAEVEWFESDDGSLQACIPAKPVGKAESYLFYSFPKEDDRWVTPRVYRVVNLCGR